MKIYLHVYTVLKKITFSYSFNHTFNQHIFCFSRFRNGCAREKIKGVKSIGKVQCHVIRYPSAREDSDWFFFWCTMVVYKVFPRKLRILFLSVNAFPLSRQINSAAKKF